MKKCFGCQGGGIRSGVVPENVGESVDSARLSGAAPECEDAVMAPNGLFNGLLEPPPGREARPGKRARTRRGRALESSPIEPFHESWGTPARRRPTELRTEPPLHHEDAEYAAPVARRPDPRRSCCQPPARPSPARRSEEIGILGPTAAAGVENAVPGEPVPRGLGVPPRPRIPSRPPTRAIRASTAWCRSNSQHDLRAAARGPRGAPGLACARCPRSTCGTSKRTRSPHGRDCS